MRAIKAGIVYFLVVLLIGFALGTARVVWLVPVVGDRSAELLEIPMMVAISYFVARFLLGRIEPSLSRACALAMGGVALALMLTAEFTIVLGIRGLSVSDYVAGRDKVSGAAYCISLILFMLLPWLITTLAGRRDRAIP